MNKFRSELAYDGVINGIVCRIRIYTRNPYGIQFDNTIFDKTNEWILIEYDFRSIWVINDISYSYNRNGTFERCELSSPIREALSLIVDTI